MQPLDHFPPFLWFTYAVEFAEENIASLAALPVRISGKDTGSPTGSVAERETRKYGFNAGLMLIVICLRLSSLLLQLLFSSVPQQETRVVPTNPKREG